VFQLRRIFRQHIRLETSEGGLVGRLGGAVLQSLQRLTLGLEDKKGSIVLSTGNVAQVRNFQRSESPEFLYSINTPTQLPVLAPDRSTRP
jgi:hypothetical protein